MRLTRIEWWGYCVPLRRRFLAAGSSADFRYGLLLQVHAGSGASGTGEASPVGSGDERSVRDLSDHLRAAAPLVLGEAVPDAPSLRSVAGRLAGMPGPLRFGLETALFDLLGKASGRPVVSLLGGSPRPVPVNALLSADSSDGAAAEARKAVVAGFATLKLKIGYSSPESDVMRLEAVRGAVGPRIALRADANQAWTVKQAIENMGLLERFRLEYVEQPVAADDLGGLAAVKQAVATPVAADEALGGAEDARRLISMKAAGFLVVKPARFGLMESLEIIKLAGAAGLPAVITSSLESDVGIAAALHLASAMPPESPACGLATGALLASGLVSHRLAPSAGAMVCPDEPGLGVRPDIAAVARYSTGITGSITA